jgi:uncharacterized metal-binding protein
MLRAMFIRVVQYTVIIIIAILVQYEYVELGTSFCHTEQQEALVILLFLSLDVALVCCTFFLMCGCVDRKEENVAKSQSPAILK